MQEIRKEIKENIQGIFKGFYYENSEIQLNKAKTICFLLDAYHKIERPYYRKRRFKYADTDSFKKRGEVLKNGTNTEL